MRPAAAAPDLRLFAVIVLISGLVFAGFARNYYLRAWLGTRPLTVLAHLHGLVMTAWMLLFVLQAWLVRQRRLAVHRAAGIGAAALAALIVGLGVVTIEAAIGRNVPGAHALQSAELFVAYDGLSLLLFGALVTLALVRRAEPVIHRRLMFMALISLLPPAFGRLVAYLSHTHVEITVLALMLLVVALCVLADRLVTHRWHAVLLLSGLAIVGVNLLTYRAQVAT